MAYGEVKTAKIIWLKTEKERDAKRREAQRPETVVLDSNQRWLIHRIVETLAHDEEMLTRLIARRNCKRT